MYAVVFQVDMKENWEGDADQDLDQLVAFAKSLPGFVRGTWTADGRRGLSFLLFASEDEARSVATAPSPPDGPATLRSVDVYEVQRDV
jgi:hypothetical protein